VAPLLLPGANLRPCSGLAGLPAVAGTHAQGLQSCPASVSASPPHANVPYFKSIVKKKGFTFGNSVSGSAKTNSFQKLGTIQQRRELLLAIHIQPIKELFPC